MGERPAPGAAGEGTVGCVEATAPGRCGIVGNPSDMYGGSVLSIATAERATCRVVRAEGLVLSSSGQERRIHDAQDLADAGDRLDLLRAVARWFALDGRAGLRIETETDIPMQAGLAGSTALVVAAVGALDAWFGWGAHPWAMAETARKVEFRQLGVLCGLQDQHMAVFGGLNFMDFRGKEMLEQRDDEPLATVEPLGGRCGVPPLVAAHTGVRHHSGAVHRSPRERWLAGERDVVDAFARVAALARVAKRALLDQDWPALGRLMDENHAVVAGLGGSGPQNDRLIEAARAAGAWGAKLAGAGGGGTILALAADPPSVGSALLAAGADRLIWPTAGPGLTTRRT
ncbi:MAG TPA: hypothetical protein VLH79_03865 [Chthonomonadales bacterium]|nr:hypothetical protein [Chthonomonadales bacterium]